MIEQTMLEATATMRQAADEIVRLRRERNLLERAMRHMLEHDPVVERSSSYGRTYIASILRSLENMP